MSHDRVGRAPCCRTLGTGHCQEDRPKEHARRDRLASLLKRLAFDKLGPDADSDMSRADLSSGGLGLYLIQPPRASSSACSSADVSHMIVLVVARLKRPMWPIFMMCSCNEGVPGPGSEVSMRLDDTPAQLHTCWTLAGTFPGQACTIQRLTYVWTSLKTVRILEAADITAELTSSQKRPAKTDAVFKVFQDSRCGGFVIWYADVWHLPHARAVFQLRARREPSWDSPVVHLTTKIVVQGEA